MLYICCHACPPLPAALVLEMTEFFHVAPARLQQGQIVRPGTWGQTLRKWQKGGQTFTNHSEAYVLVWEVALEAVRRAVKPGAPSRLDCVFACPSQSEAITFRDRFRPSHQIYSVSVASGVSAFIADYDVITNSIDGPFVDTFVDQAFRYWTATPVGMREVLIGGEVTVAEVLDRHQR